MVHAEARQSVFEGVAGGLHAKTCIYTLRRVREACLREVCAHWGMALHVEACQGLSYGCCKRLAC